MGGLIWDWERMRGCIWTGAWTGEEEGLHAGGEGWEMEEMNSIQAFIFFFSKLPRSIDTHITCID